MKLYLKQRVFSWGDKFTVYDECGNDRYYVHGKAFTMGKKLHLCDLAGNELLFIRQKLFTFFPKYHILKNGVEVAEVVKNFSFFRPKYTIHGLDWSVQGDFFDHTYEIRCGSHTVASVSKRWFTLGDAYELDIDPTTDPITALAVVLVIDACIDAQNNS